MLQSTRTRNCTSALILLFLIVGVWAQEARDAQPYLHHGHDLGVVSVQLYAKAPVLLKEKVLLVNVWLKRVTWGNISEGNALPERSEVHGFAWLEDLDGLNRNHEGRMMMGVDPNVWQPRLRLETPRGGLLSSQPVTEVVPDPRVKSSLRPFHFTFMLDPKFPGRCFKMYEESLPGHKASFCLPMTSQRLCRRLAAAEDSVAGLLSSSASGVPALWSLVFPLRSAGINGTHWEYHSRLVANRVFNYAVYQIGIGGAGVLVYADRLTRAALERIPRISGLIARGRLVMVTWDMPERANPMAYKYDQALVSSHALLGLSACGPGVMLLLSDLDEYLYSAFGHGWPAIHACLAKADPRATLHRIQRIDAASTRLEPGRESAWWVLPARSLARHPIMSYDRIRREALPPELSTALAAPSARVVGFYVHDGVPMAGTSALASANCALLLHMPNYWGPRGASASAATIAAAGAGGTLGGGTDSLDDLLNPGGNVGAGGRGSADGGRAAAADAAAPGGAAISNSTDYTPFKVAATWAVGPAATAALDTGITVGGGGGGGGRGGRLRMGGSGTGGSWRGIGADDGEDGGRIGGGAVGSGSGVGAAAAAAALAAANAAAAVLAAAVAPGGAGQAGSDATATATAGQSQGASAAGGGGTGNAGAGLGTAIAADADRWAALAAEKAKVGEMGEKTEAKPEAAGASGQDATASGSGRSGGGGGPGSDPLAWIRAAKKGGKQAPGSSGAGRR